ncbi:MAG: DUF4290 domain-containing protein [Candidatus Shikimatogenerans bostrichidophilus]|nr:MAG: DUF4290 domain-containing protein [Candidatus Shikimatogenerans bostrichidophilus]
MKYNIYKRQLIYPEYGRNIQKLINKISNIKNNEIKKFNINHIYNFMININNKIKSYYSDYKKKISIQLFYLSNKKILLNNLYNIKNILLKKNIDKKNIILLMKKKYINSKKNKYKYYGNNIIISLFIILNFKKIKINYINNLLDLMKRKYLKWNKIKTINNFIIYYDIYRITNGKINILNFIYK